MWIQEWRLEEYDEGEGQRSVPLVVYVYGGVAGEEKGSESGREVWVRVVEESFVR